MNTSGLILFIESGSEMISLNKNEYYDRQEIDSDIEEAIICLSGVIDDLSLHGDYEEGKRLSDYPNFCYSLSILDKVHQKIYGSNIEDGCHLNILPPYTEVIINAIRLADDTGQMHASLKVFNILDIAEHAKILAMHLRHIRRSSPSEPTAMNPAKKSIWINKPNDPNLDRLIIDVISLLDAIIRQIDSDNSPENKKILSKIQKSQLISVLKTAINVLESPLIEQSILIKTTKELQDAGKKAIEKSAQGALQSIIAQAIDKIVDLIKYLPWL